MIKNKEHLYELLSPKGRGELSASYMHISQFVIAGKQVSMILISDEKGAVPELKKQIEKMFPNTTSGS